MVAAAKNMVTVAVATGLAGLIVGSISLSGIGAKLSDVVEFVAGNNIIFDLAFNCCDEPHFGYGATDYGELYCC